MNIELPKDHIAIEHSPIFYRNTASSNFVFLPDRDDNCELGKIVKISKNLPQTHCFLKTGHRIYYKKESVIWIKIDDCNIGLLHISGFISMGTGHRYYHDLVGPYGKIKNIEFEINEDIAVIENNFFKELIFVKDDQAIVKIRNHIKNET